MKEVTIIPLDNYLDDEEVKLWLQGDPIQTEGMNGVEIYGKLFDIREKFYQWINRNMLEINYRILCQQTHRSSQQERITELQKVDRDILFKDMNGDQPSYSEDVIDPSFDKLCKFLDNQFSTGFYSALYTTHKETMDKQLEEQTLILNLFGVEQLYEVRLPGKLLTTNAPHIKDESPVWKVNAYYFLAEDFVLTAESRKSNAWAFIVTGLLIGIAIVSSILIKNRKN
ncbi:MAG: hypothetical protein LIP01_15615 [Tannerellaceae bacterium]|nr:hypothetical protein [Tannerellaceae bacterium]